jgi:hypothetical protein
MNGSIEVRSRIGLGSTFTMRLPVWSEEPNADQEKTVLSPFAAAPANSTGGVVEQEEKVHGQTNTRR